MRNKAISIILTLIMVVGIVPAASITASAEDEIVEVTVSGIANYDYANEVVALVNEERAAEGLNPLVMDVRLTDWAMQRAAELAFYYSHVRPDGTGWSDLAGDFSNCVFLAGENIASGTYLTGNGGVFPGWMGSPGHRANILNSNYDTIGVGCVTIGATSYWVQWFAGFKDEKRGYDYDAIQSTYSDTKMTTFTVSTYTSYLNTSVQYESLYSTILDGMIDSTDNYLDGALRAAIGESVAVYLKNDSPKSDICTIVPITGNIKDSSTGKVIATTSVAANGAVTITPTAAGTGYLYLYAYEGASPQSVKIIVSAGYTVTFTYNGSDIGVSSQTVAYGKTATEPEAPKKDGYVFLYWSYYKMSSKYGLTGEYDFSTPVTHDVALDANYIVARTVTFDSNGGSSVSSQTVAHNSTATEPTAPTRSGYMFAGWYTAASGGTKYDFSSPVKSNLTLYAHWTANTSGSSSTGNTTTAASDITTKSEETTKSSETTASSSETTKSSSTTTGESVVTTKAAETTKDSETTASPGGTATTKDSDSETSTKSDEETTAAEETTGVPDEDETTAPDETADTSDTETTDDTDETETAYETETEVGTNTETTADESGSVASDEKNASDSDNAVAANNGDDNGGDDNSGVAADEDNSSYTWAVVLVVVLLAAACAVPFAVLKKKKNDNEIADIKEGSDTAEGDSESESSDAENHDDGGGDNTEE